MANFDPIQQEAMRRVQAMQSRAVPKKHDNIQKPPTPEASVREEPQNQQEINQAPPLVKNQVSQDISSKDGNPLEVLFKDKEQNLILMLIILLAGDGADTSLLLALIYLLI